MCATTLPSAVTRKALRSLFSAPFSCLFLLTYICLVSLHLYAFYTNYIVSNVNYIVLLTGRQYIKSDLQIIRISLSFLIPSLFLLRRQHLLIFLPHIKNRSDDKIAKITSYFHGANLGRIKILPSDRSIASLTSALPLFAPSTDSKWLRRITSAIASAFQKQSS